MNTITVAWSEHTFAHEGATWRVAISPAGEITVMRRRHNLHSSADPGAWDVLAGGDPARWPVLECLARVLPDLADRMRRHVGRPPTPA
jgi:hypothetical protein